MFKKKSSKIAGGVVAGLLAACAVTMGVFHHGTYVVYKNLTLPKLSLDENAAWDGGETYMSVPYAEVSASDYVDLYVPAVGADGELPKLFVLVHGGGFISGDSQTRQTMFMYQYFRDHGYACATVNYRLAQEAAFPAALEDVKAAVRFLRAHADEYGYDASKVAIWGESAGGYLASIAAVTTDDEFMELPYIGQDEAEANGEMVSAACDVLVDFYGAVDLNGMKDDWKVLDIPQVIIDIANSWVPSSSLEGYENVEDYFCRLDRRNASDEEKRYSDVYYYTGKNMGANDKLSVWIAHGDCDITVPQLQSIRFYDQLKELIGEDRVHLNIVNGSGHASDILYSEDELDSVLEFLNKHM